MSAQRSKMAAVNCDNDALTAVDAVVLKRMKFVLKIIKSLVPQTHANRSRQGHVFILEVLDTISDWSGHPYPEVMDLIDKQIFPLICRLVSTFTKDEFNTFQQFFCKYLLLKWEETSNFIALDFLADIYGFIAKIAPATVSVELVQVFQQEEMPPHVTLVILPSVIKNIPEAVFNNVDNNMSMLRGSEISAEQRRQIEQFWSNLIITAVGKIRTVYQLAPVLRQCTMSSFYLEFLEAKSLHKILKCMTEWGYNLENDSFSNLEGFLLVMVILLHSISCIIIKTDNCDLFEALKILMKQVTMIVNLCSDRSVRVFTLRVVQRILEYAPEDGVEVFTEFVSINQTHEFNFDSNGESSKNYALIEALESSVNRISNELDFQVNEVERRKIKKMINSLQTLLNRSDS